MPHQERKEMLSLSPAGAAAFLEAAKADRYHALFSLLLGTGLRPGEALALKWEDVDFDNGLLSVRRTLTRTGDFSEPKTQRGRRSITLPSSLVRELREHRRRQAEERLARGGEYANVGLVFASEHGQPVNYRNLVRRHFKPIVRKANLPGALRLYDSEA